MQRCFNGGTIWQSSWHYFLDEIGERSQIEFSRFGNGGGFWGTQKNSYEVYFSKTLFMRKRAGWSCRCSSFFSQIQYDLLFGSKSGVSQPRNCFNANKKAFNELDSDKDIVVSTFREGDDKGAAARAFYKKFGFVEGELIEEFGYPCQVFTLHR